MKSTSVKLFSETELETLEDEINKFINDKQILDIKYAMNDFPRYSALIIYKELKQESEIDETDELVYF